MIAEPLGELEQMRLALGLGLRDYVEKNGFREVVVGVSGGIDSALTAAIAAEALGPERVHCVSMPSRFTSEGTRGDARRLAELLGTSFLELPIGPAVEAFEGALAEPFAGLAPDLTEENIQARARGVLLMALSNKFGWLLLATGNKSELSVGYCTLYGDMSGGLAVISDLPKGMVYEVARAVNDGRRFIPERVFERPPTAELRPGQKDEDSLPPYPLLDRVLKAYVEDELSVPEIVALGLDEELVARVVGMVDRNEYKRQQAPPGLRVTSKAFGVGRRMPIAQAYLPEPPRPAAVWPSRTTAATRRPSTSGTMSPTSSSPRRVRCRRSPVSTSPPWSACSCWPTSRSP